MNALQRRREMMLAEKSSPTGALYPLPDVDIAGLKIDNGNHVTFSGTGSNQSYINLTDGEYSGQASTINNKPTKFTIPKGSYAELTIEMVTFDVAVWGNRWAINYRNANATTSGNLGTGDKRTAETVTVSYTAAQNVDVGCFFVFLSSSNVSLEFTISLYVDGVQYI